MKPLVIGASGFIGNVLWRRLASVGCHGTFCGYPLPGLIQLDICDRLKVHALIKRLCPSVIFLPAAIPSVDLCESEPEQCWATNVEGVCNIICTARDISAKLVLFSTDYVFDGECGPYSETDEPRPINVYGKAKLAAERAVREQLADCLIVRTNGVYGWERRRKNFVAGMIDRLCKGQQMKVPIDQVGSPTYAENMVDAVLELVDLNQSGIFHVAGSQIMDRYTFACTVADTFELDRSLLVPVRTVELRQKAPRPLKAGLRVEKMHKVVMIPPLGADQGLRLMKEQGDPFGTDDSARSRSASHLEYSCQR